MRLPVTGQDEIGQLALAFNNMASSLASGENVRHNFIANVSHELKTPMTTIAGFIDGILDGTIPREAAALFADCFCRGQAAVPSGAYDAGPFPD